MGSATDGLYFAMKAIGVTKNSTVICPVFSYIATAGAIRRIGADIRLDPVMLDKEISIEEMLSFYMGKNTPTRQEFIINNLKVELDKIEETA